VPSALKDPDSENLDAGWDDLDPVAPPVPSIASEQPEGLDELDDGWDEASPDEPRAEVPGGRPVGSSKRLGKRERQEAARRAAAEHEEERRRALERRERERKKEERPKRRREDSPGRVTRKSRSEAATPRARDSEERPRKRFEMPNGGWIIVVIALITLATAWYAFWR